MRVPCNVAHLPTHFCVSSISTASGLGQSSDVGDEDSPSAEHSASPAGRGRRGCRPWPHSVRRPGPSPSLRFGGHVRPLRQLSFVVWKPLLSCFWQLFLQVRFGDFWFVWVFVVFFFFNILSRAACFPSTLLTWSTAAESQGCEGLMASAVKRLPFTEVQAD